MTTAKKIIYKIRQIFWFGVLASMFLSWLYFSFDVIAEGSRNGNFAKALHYKETHTMPFSERAGL